jgi:hypothetical protein
MLAPLNSGATELQVVSPNTGLAPATLAKTAGRWEVKPLEPGVGGFHLLLARETHATEIRTASTAWMFHAKALSPTSMLSAQRRGLVIQPLLLPEHGGFREGSTWEFLIRFDGSPVPGAILAFDTENGSHSTLAADDKGLARVSFPRDFDPASLAGDSNAARIRRGFALGVELERDGVRHLTGFNHSYYPDPMRQRSLLGGVGLLAFGMVLATPMLRRKKEKTNA